jgi:hypothetical protein
MTAETLRVLIIGGYGVFGGRIVRLLADEPRLTLIVAGRSKTKAEAFCAHVEARAEIVAEFFDRDADPEKQIARLRPNIVVDAAGPFQAYGDDPYRVASAAMVAGADYIDLADSPEFVCGVERLDEMARSLGRFAISGASTCPALTAAIVAMLAERLVRVEAIEAGIAPSPFAEMGLSVMRAIAGYAGHTLLISCGGQTTKAVALVDSRRHTISPAGVRPLKERLFSLVDVPDLGLLPKHWPDLQSVWFGAGPAPVFLHRIFVTLAWLSHQRLLPSLLPAAPLLYRARKLARWGENRGGMYVVVEGAGADGARLRREWSLIAEGDDGPYIPAMAAAALVLKSRDGLGPSPGARTAVGTLDYHDFETFFVKKRISTGIRDVNVCPPRSV